MMLPMKIKNIAVYFPDSVIGNYFTTNLMPRNCYPQAFFTEHWPPNI